MNRIVRIGLLVVMAGLATMAHAKTPLVAVSQFVDHPALNAVLQGFKDDLFDSGVEVRYKEYNAHGNMGTAVQIASQIASDSPDLIVAIATPCAQACAKVYDKAPQLGDTPMLFTAITDPLAAGLVSDYAKPGPRITGVSNQMPMGKHLDMIRKFMPGVKKIGVMYNSGEVNSVSNVRRLKAAAADRNIAILDAPVTASASVYQAARSLVGKVDAVYVPTDNTVVSVLEGVIKICERTKLPLFSADTDSVARGSIAALGFDYYLHGRQTGAMARKILAGAKPSELPVEFQENLSFHINPGAAERMGLAVDKTLIESADKLHR
ncbi:ABC transporter substrate-binding protein [Desulforhopalus singaporensis]|uniref:Putative ABC transport system substrate-binding protein n=1 Tax=Desulforhopalus singaporensis TaxID=91360 RepID=A0A1H0V3Q7_9BACT|nr:ABC transporter substrate-binding protein [Desulforhopalus singaporensis]SDP72994.1 putative ABC transport system substrate-binding protein [Desulforhopalus singaporensis]